MATDPLASLRAKIKAAKPAATSQVKAPSTTDPLASLRAKIKSGKSRPSVDYTRWPIADRLNRLEHITGALLTAAPNAAQIQSSAAQLKPATEAAKL